MDKQIEEIIKDINKKAKDTEKEFVEKIEDEIDGIFNELRGSIINPISESSKKVSEDLNKHVSLVKDLAEKSELEYNDKLRALRNSHQDMVTHSDLLKNRLLEHMKHLNDLQGKRLEDDNKNELFLKKIIESLEKNIHLNRHLKEDCVSYVNQLDSLIKEEHHDTSEKVNELKLLFTQVQTNSNYIDQKLDQLVDNDQKNDKQWKFLLDELNKKQVDIFEYITNASKEHQHVFEKKSKIILSGLVGLGIIEALILITMFVR